MAKSCTIDGPAHEMLYAISPRNHFFFVCSKCKEHFSISPFVLGLWSDKALQQMEIKHTQFAYRDAEQVTKILKGDT